MFNLIMADLKIMFRYPETWLCIVGQLIFLAATIAGYLPIADISLIAEGYTIPYLMLLSINVAYFMIVVLFIFAYDFEMGMIKNTLTNGVTRKTYFFARLIVAYIFTFMFYLVHIIGGILLATLIHGSGALNLATLAVPLLLQLLILFTISTVGVGFVFAFRKSANFGTAFIFSILSPPFIFAMTTQIDNIIERLQDFELTTQLTRVANSQLLEPSDIINILLLSTVYLVVSVVVGIIIFEKVEIK